MIEVQYYRFLNLHLCWITFLQQFMTGEPAHCTSVTVLKCKVVDYYNQLKYWMNNTRNNSAINLITMEIIVRSMIVNIQYKVVTRLLLTNVYYLANIPIAMQQAARSPAFSFQTSRVNRNVAIAVRPLKNGARNTHTFLISIVM